MAKDGFHVDFPEDVTCTGCDEQPSLVYDPSGDAPYQLQCECDMTAVDVTHCLEETSLVEMMTGKWSQFDHESSMKDHT